jgi:hypothetical protein
MEWHLTGQHQPPVLELELSLIFNRQVTHEVSAMTTTCCQPPQPPEVPPEVSSAVLMYSRSNTHTCSLVVFNRYRNPAAVNSCLRQTAASSRQLRPGRALHVLLLSLSRQCMQEQFNCCPQPCCRSICGGHHADDSRAV